MGRNGSGVEVRHEGQGSIRVSFTYDGQFYRRTLMLAGQPMRPTAANVKFAHRLVAEVRERIKHGTFVLAEYFPVSGEGPGATTVAAQLERWLGAQRLEASTLDGYNSAARFWKAAQYDPKDAGRRLGDLALRAVKLGDILTALAKRPDLAGKTVNNYVSVLREAFALAHAEGLVSENVVERVPRAKHQKEPPDPFSREEAEAIIADAAAHYPGQVANLIEWWMFTGVRPSEATGLRWPNVDLAGSYMRISEAVVRGVEKDRTKTAVARDVLLNSRARAAIERQRKHTQLAGEHVWLDPRYGTPWVDERAFRRSYWTPILKRLGFRYRPPRMMRHTFATMMLMSGRTPAWCAKQLGHSLEMFIGTYSRWITGAQDAREVAGFEQWLAGPAGKDEVQR